MCGLIKGQGFIKKLMIKLKTHTVYQVKNGHQTNWITLDELMKQNKEKHFYQNLLGEQKYEISERNFRNTITKHEDNKILSVSTFHSKE